MITLRKAEDRFVTRVDWLDSRHTFSFGDHHDPEHMGFRALRVLNDDRVAAGAGFPPHPHRDMEIVSVVLEGALAHRDSMGNGSVIRPGEVQRMTAGTGIVHSEMNPSPEEPTRFLQIWIVPQEGGLAPGCEQRSFPFEERTDELVLVASRDGHQGSVTIHQDVSLWIAVLGEGRSLLHELRDGRHVWVQVASGALELYGLEMREGDGAAISSRERIDIVGRAPRTELLLFDLA
jgi:redox-sensitive bicupin YhaK (pirin superfamily)